MSKGKQAARRSLQRFSRWKISRQIVQVLAFCGWIWLITRIDSSTLPGNPSTSPSLFLRVDPLVSLTGVIHSLLHGACSAAGLLLLWALPVLVLSALFGRVFCGWLCPLGCSIDAADRLVPHRTSPEGKPPRHWLKYALLTAFLLTAICGSQLLYLFDPIPLITRSMVTVVFPFLGWLAGPLQHRFFPNWEAASLFGAGYQGNLLGMAWLLAILGLGYFGRRYWCRVLCPLGALLGWVSRIAPFGRRLTGECRRCARCVKDCRMAATADGASILSGECLACGSCQAVCPTGLIRFGNRTQTAPSPEPVDLSRRRVLTAGVAGIACVGLLHTGASARLRAKSGSVANQWLLRPPGALPEQDFLSRCTRCGACLKACPTGGLQPSISEAGLEGVWSPVLVPRMGECAAGCNACAQVCPTNAIRMFPPDDKSHIYIGTARVDHSACLMWQDSTSKKCLVCQEHCPYGAIYLNQVNGKPVPCINEALCVGCGTCEKGCPIKPTAAIRVRNAKPYGDHREMTFAEQLHWQQQQQPMYPKTEKDGLE